LRNEKYRQRILKFYLILRILKTFKELDIIDIIFDQFM